MGRWLKNWFSNYVPIDGTPFRYGANNFQTVEAFYQAQKYTPIHEKKITAMAKMKPWEAKAHWRDMPANKRILYMRANWHMLNNMLMEIALSYKFRPGTAHHKNLMLHSGPIVEKNNWHDNYWGDCICGAERCAKQGENRLGKILTKLKNTQHKPLNLIIAGSRTITESKHVGKALTYAGVRTVDVDAIVSGRASGVDAIGEHIAQLNMLPVVYFPANWEDLGKKAGHIRNKQMAEYADALIAVWDGSSRGTLNMISTMRNLGKPWFVYDVNNKACSGSVWTVVK